MEDDLLTAMSAEKSEVDERLKDAQKKCTRYVNHHQPKTMKQWFSMMADFIDEDDKADGYGEGKYLQNFEKEVAELLGKEAAVFMPSGTMAQQIALRIWADKSNNYKVVMHPTAHLEMAEHFGYKYLHHLERVQLSIPDYTGQRLLTFDDFNKLKEKPGTVLLELPQRPLGGQLPEWDELVKISKWAKEKNIRLHLDGARLWEAQPYYGQTLAEIADLFDSVYVSFYKGLDGIAGSMLLGPQVFVDEAKIWQRRMGGNLRSQFPLYIAGKWGLQHNLPRMKEYYDRSKQLAAKLNQMDGIDTNPTIPQTNMFQIHIRANEDQIKQAQLKVAEETGIWIMNNTLPSSIPVYRWTEIVIASAAMELELDEIVSAFELFSQSL